MFFLNDKNIWVEQIYINLINFCISSGVTNSEFVSLFKKISCESANTWSIAVLKITWEESLLFTFSQAASLQNNPHWVNSYYTIEEVSLIYVYQ